jgi:tetratricopeptide (TPR) repeat protein
LVFLVVLTACPHPRDSRRAGEFGPVTDAPWELEDDADWQEVRDQMFGLKVGDSRRHDLRVQLAAAQADRIGRWLDANRPNLAYEAMLDLAGLWGDDPALLGGELKGQKASIERARKTFARAGADQEVVLALVLLGEIDPAERDARWAEIDEVLAFADELAIAQNGPDAVRGRPIQILHPIAMALPLKAVTDRYVDLVAQRQAAVGEALSKNGASFEIVRAHGDVLHAARALAAALARAGRAEEIAARIQGFQGIGADEKLVAKAATLASARDWAVFARAFRSTDAENDDPATARAIAIAGLARFDHDATLLATAAQASIAMDRVHEPIRLLEALRDRGAGDAKVAAELSDLYRQRLAALAFDGRPVEAGKRLAELEKFLASAKKEFPGKPWDEDLADALATAGRGMVTEGELDAAIQYLQRSVTVKPDPEAYEMLATIALKRERFGEARAFAERGANLAVRDKTGAGLYIRAKLLKLEGDANAGLGDGDAAQKQWVDALELWADVGDGGQLPPALAGERLVQAGELLWKIGQRDEALRLLDGAVEVDPDGADTHTQQVAFFILQGEYARALDTFHRAVIADRISDYHKVYLSLWVLAEARRRGVEPDPLAVEYLANRDGVLWHDDMARLATGRIGVAELQARATTRGRKAELAYYTAVLGLGEGGAQRPPAEVRALLEHVVATDMVLFFEYEMARHWLAVGP